MSRIFKYSLILLCLTATLSCEDEGLDIKDVDIPDGYALSAGTSTIFVNSSFAYDTPAEWVKSNTAYQRRFNLGDRLYDDARSMSNAWDRYMQAIHAEVATGNAGRTKPALWNDGGSGPYGFSAMLVYVSRRNGSLLPGLRTGTARPGNIRCRGGRQTEREMAL